MINFDFNDILITPAVTSTIRSRKEINPYYQTESNWLPIIVSPMDTVIGLDNWKLFLDQKMPICFPRGIRPENIKEEDQQLLNSFGSSIFFSYSLDETADLVRLLNENPKLDLYHNILIDIANGHMQHMVDVVRDLKKRTKVKVMVGNIANPLTYQTLSEAGADYVRVGIGFGGGCLTAMNTGIGYSMASLIDKCDQVKKNLKGKGKSYAAIVGDGGFREYSDIIKALALGADYVMLGSMLNKCLESSGQTYLNCKFFRIPVFGEVAKYLYKRKYRLYLIQKNNIFLVRCVPNGI